MSDTINFKIDGKECSAKNGQFLVEAAEQNGVYIPTLCHLKGIMPAGYCRICSIKANGRMLTACTTKVKEGMEIENDTTELLELRKIILETLFVSGNHYCPSCEKSGSCILQALSYKYRIMIPRFPYSFDVKRIDASSPKLVLERNRCVLCKRCVRSIKNKDGKSYFAVVERGYDSHIVLDKNLAMEMTDSEAELAMKNCPVGCILKKEIGFSVPIGKRLYDTKPIGADIEENITTKL